MDNLYGYDIGGGVVCGRDVSSWTDTDLAGNPPFKAADSLPAGYVQIDGTATAGDADNAIQFWNKYSAAASRDYLYTNKKLAALRDVHGYSAMITDTKKILLQRFKGGAGNDWTDVIYTDAQYLDFFVTHAANMKNTAIMRNDKAMAKLKKQVFVGNMTLSVAEKIGADTLNFQTAFIDNIKLGISEGDAIEGILDWIENTNKYQGLTITLADTGANEFGVSGNYKNDIIPGQSIKIIGSTGNDGVYIVDSIRKQSSTTYITPVEDITNPTADGELFWIGFKKYDGYTDALRDEMANLYRYGF